MKTSPLPHNYNKKSFVLAALVYMLVLLLAYTFMSKPKAQQLNVGSQSVVLSFNDIKALESNTVKNTEPQQEKQETAHVEQKIKPQPLEQKAVAKKVIKKETKPQIKKEQKQKRKEQKEPKKQTQKQLNNTNVANTKTQTTTKPTKAHSQHLVFGQDHNPILLAMKQAIDKNLAYPRKARLMKHQGIAVISFKYKHRKLLSKKLVKSSGFKILDKAALATIDRASTSFPISDDLLTITIPIEFKLR